MYRQGNLATSSPFVPLCLRVRFVLLLLCVLAISSCQRGPCLVAFLSDFGLQTEAVGLCHGAMLREAPGVRIVDLTHQVEAYNIEHAARMLARATTFPRGTVFVAVVDPGVGTARLPIAIETQRGYTFIAPDNGLLSEVIRTQGIAAAWRIDPTRVNAAWHPGTFDGRDLFSPAAAQLAAGRALDDIATPMAAGDVLIKDFPRGELGADGVIRGRYLRTDEPYGNIWTDIDRATLEQAAIRPLMPAVGDAPTSAAATLLMVRIGAKEIDVPLVTTFGQVPEGAPLAYINSDERLALALNMGDLRKALGVQEGDAVEIRRAR